MSETHTRVVDAVMEAILSVLPDVPMEDLRPERSLVELGATSIDRVEVAMAAMEALGLVMRPAELAGIATIGALIERLEARLASRPG
jgi:acyl carrier protein